MALGIGESLGNYRIIQRIGSGAMGTVYLAEHPLIGKRVALKVIHRDLSTNQDVVTRFFHEARAVNQIGHEHIVDITDYGQTHEGEYFFIMELLSGRSLTDLMELDGVLHPQRALHIGAQVADALAASHAVGIVHRDVKPDNVFLIHRRGDNDFVKLLDFGLAKISHAAGDVITRRGVILGTPQYMSPEQCESMSAVDPRSDVYSLGILLYQMMTGTVPFDGAGMGEILMRQVNEPPQPPRARNPYIPVSAEAVILRALAKRPEHRFQTMADFQAAMLDPEGYAAAIPGAAPTTMLPALGAEAPPPADYFAMLPPDAPTPPPVPGFSHRLSQVQPAQPAPAAPSASSPSPGPSPHRVEVRVRKERWGAMWLLLALAASGVTAAVLLLVLRGTGASAGAAAAPAAGAVDAAPRAVMAAPAPAPAAVPVAVAPDASPVAAPVVEPLPAPAPAPATPPATAHADAPRPKPAAQPTKPRPKPQPKPKPRPKPGDDILEPTF
jgi:serine/threonine-protein kinase